jgi:Type I phosphodiesterase / nucleotide pyrophosphatase
MGLRFKSGADESKYIQSLQKAAILNNEKFDVYTHDTMPERYHFSNNPRISPVYVVPKLGYALTETHKTGLTFVKGVRLLSSGC